MDALDATILRELGVEPFAGWHHRPRGLRATDVATALGRSVRLVQDRITRMESDGIIQGYALVPNPRHLGLGLTTYHVPTADAADERLLGDMSNLDGFVQAIAYLGSGVCLSLSHDSQASRDRRLALAARLGSGGDPRPMYSSALPSVDRPLTALDWRIIASLAGDAKKQPVKVAEELGVTAKTVRARLNRMRDEGSIDEVAQIDFRKMDGIMPFEIAVWDDDSPARPPDVLGRLQDNYWGHFEGPPGGFCDLLFRVFTTSPAEAQSLVAGVARIPGVKRADALMGAGQVEDHRWLQEAIAARLAAENGT